NEIYKKISRKELFEETGVYPTTINSIVQIYADLQRYPWLKEVAQTILFMPDLFNYFLPQERVTNYSIASTSALLSKNQRWCKTIIETLNLPEQLFNQEIVNISIVGELTSSDIQHE